jgi:CRISPR-associated protein Csd1
LLGAADKLEEYALFKKEKDRVTAAIRHMQTFAQRPFSTWQTIHSCLNPYIKTVKGGFAFQEIEQIKNKFLSVEDFRKDTPLDGSYLIGYYHERAYIDNLVNVSKKKTTDNNEKEDNND